MVYSKEEAKEEVRKLVAKYENCLKSGEIEKYDESNLRRVFIDTLFELLGWDLKNIDEVYSEQNVEGKRVDYAFKINDVPKFYVEAKPPKTDLSKWAQKTIDYGHQSDVEWVILTDFETFILYDAQANVPYPEYAAIKNMRFRYTEYIEKFDLLWLLSKESILENKLNTILEGWGRKPSKDPITTEIFKHLDDWRGLLIRNARKNKSSILEEELDDYVQNFINRLIFIRVCEDRGVDIKTLEVGLKDWRDGKIKDLTEMLFETFERFKETYDSELFEEYNLNKLKIDDGATVKVLKELTKFDFEAITVDILGSVYEQYLGSIIKKSGKIEEKVGKRKGMGIYYTPTYIVDYIVKNTVGELLKNTKTEDIKKIKVLDPACGSGSFLIKAYDVIEKEIERRLKRKLTEKEKSEILINNIFGVDLDHKAVEITRLNLLLKTVERKETLPNLKNNIKCGNSLIDDPLVAGDNAFKWDKQFAEIKNSGGFDAIIGNPPYINNRNLPKKEKQFFENNYKTAFQQYDIYVLFYELGLGLLNKEGYLGFIAPNKFAVTNYGLPLRKIFLDNRLIKIIDVSQLGVFAEASTYPYIVILQKVIPKNNKIKVYTPVSSNFDNMNLIEVNQSDLNSKETFIFNIKNEELDIVNKITGEKVIEIYRAKPTTKDIFNQGDLFVITNREIERYRLLKFTKKISKKKEWVIDTPAILMKKLCFTPTSVILDCKNAIPVNTVYVIHSKNEELPLQYLLGILNSKLIGYYTRKKYSLTAMRGGFIELRTFEIERIPIKINLLYKNSLVSLVNKMLSLNERLNEIDDKKTTESAKLEEERNEIDAEIDELVYKLYGITEEEKKIIGESLK